MAKPDLILEFHDEGLPSSANCFARPPVDDDRMIGRYYDFSARSRIAIGNAMLMIRQFAKKCETRVPPKLSGPLMRALAPSRNPYDEASDELETIFIHIPKTGGMNIAKTLLMRRSTHIPLSRYYAWAPDRFEKYFKFAFVRNPWDRTHSAYRNLRKFVGRDDSADGIWATTWLHDVATFEDFVIRLKNPLFRAIVTSWTHFRPQYEWVTLPFKSRHSCDFIGRFESLHEDCLQVIDQLGANAALERHEKRAGQPYDEIYTAEMIEIVGRVYRRDIQLFGYNFGP